MATPNYAIPPWIGNGADTAGNYARGLQIGARIGADQAAQQFREQQALRAQQETEFEQQYKSQKLALDVDEITRKHKAIATYMDLVNNQHMDPMQALQQVGPDIGADPTRIAEMQMHKELARQSHTHQQALETEASQRIAEMTRHNKVNEAGSAEQRKRLAESSTRKLSTADRLALQSLYKDLGRVSTSIDKLRQKSMEEPGGAETNAETIAGLMSEKLDLLNKIRKTAGASDEDTGTDATSDTTDSESPEIETQTDIQSPPDTTAQEPQPTTQQEPQPENWKTVGKWKVRAK